MTDNTRSQLYEDQPCPRCGSKKKISKKWTEILSTYHGTSKVEHMMVVCTNAICQAAFEENLKKDTAKRDVIRLEKEKKDKIRKTNSLRKSASRTKS